MCVVRIKITGDDIKHAIKWTDIKVPENKSQTSPFVRLRDDDGNIICEKKRVNGDKEH